MRSFLTALALAALTLISWRFTRSRWGHRQRVHASHRARDGAIRHAAARAAREHLEGHITYAEFLAGGHLDAPDEDVENMCDLMQHEPLRRGFLAVSDPEYLAYRAQVMAAIEKLEAS